MADLNEESKQEILMLTETISAILSEVTDLKEQVTILKESVELVEVDPEGEENPAKGCDACIAMLGSMPAEQTRQHEKPIAGYYIHIFFTSFNVYSRIIMCLIYIHVNILVEHF